MSSLAVTSATAPQTFAPTVSAYKNGGNNDETATAKDNVSESIQARRGLAYLERQ